MKAFCTGCSFAAPMPSTVVTFVFAADRAGIRQLTAGTPSTSTVQAPQTPAPQTSLVPVRSSASRTTSTSSASGSSGRGASLPLIVIVLICDLQICGRWIGTAFFAGFGLAARGFARRAHGAGDQRAQHDFQILQEGLRRLHRGVGGFGAVDRHLDAACKIARRHAGIENEALLAADARDRRGKLLRIGGGVFLVEVARLQRDVRRTVPRHGASRRARRPTARACAATDATRISARLPPCFSAAPAAAISAASASSCSRSMTARNSASLDLK